MATKSARKKVLSEFLARLKEKRRKSTLKTEIQKRILRKKFIKAKRKAMKKQPPVEPVKPDYLFEEE